MFGTTGAVRMSPPTTSTGSVLPIRDVTLGGVRRADGELVEGITGIVDRRRAVEALSGRAEDGEAERIADDVPGVLAVHRRHVNVLRGPSPDDDGVRTQCGGKTCDDEPIVEECVTTNSGEPRSDPAGGVCGLEREDTER